MTRERFSQLLKLEIRAASEAIPEGSCAVALEKASDNVEHLSVSRKAGRLKWG